MKTLYLFVILLIGTELSAQVPTDGLVAYYAFNGNANDASGNGNHGIVHGATLAVDRFGVAGKAYSLDGVDDYISLPSNVYFSGDFTFSGWCNVREVRSQCKFFDFGYGDPGDNVFMVLSLLSTGKPYGGVESGTVQGAGSAINAPSPLELNQWIHLAFELQGATFRLYRNGSLWEEGPSFRVPQNILRTRNYFGKSNWAQDPLTNAIFDDIRIYSRALNSSEIESLYNEGNGIEQGAWEKLNGPGSETTIRVFAANPQGCLYVGTSSGKVWKSSDNGNTWAQTGILPFSGTVSGLSVNADGYVFASVLGYGVCRSTDGGASWHAANSGLTSYSARMNLVDRSGHIWVATMGGVFRSTDNGNSWIIKKPGSFGVLLMDSVGAVITTYYSSSYRTTDGGDSWETFENPSGCSLLGIHPDGYYFDGNYPCGLARSTDRGATWTMLTTPFDGLTGDEGAKLTFDPSGTVYMSMGNGGVAASTDLGDTWTVVSASLPVSSWTQLFSLPNGYVFVSLAGCGVYRMMGQGGGVDEDYWVDLNGPGTETDIRVLAANSLGHLYIGTSRGTIWKTTDSGESWTQASALPYGGNVLGMSINSQDHVFVSVYGAGVFRSTDGGSSWEVKNTGLTNLNVRMSLVDKEGNVWVASEGGMFMSADNGDTWTNRLSGLYGGVLMDSTGTVVTYNTSQTFRSNNGGLTWEIIPDPPNPLGLKLSAVHPDGSYYLGGPGKCYLARSTDRGATWTVLDHPFYGAVATEGPAVVFNRAGHVFFSFGYQGVARSTDNGLSWTDVTGNLPKGGLIPLFPHQDGHVFAASHSHGLYRTRIPTTSGAFGSLRVSTISDEHLLPGTAGIVQLFDGQGAKKAETRMNEASTAAFHSVESGAGYSIRVYVHRALEIFPWGDCYWGEKGGISVSEGATTEVVFSPTTCRFIASRIFIDGTNELLQHGGARSVVPGTPLRIELDIKNPAASGTTYGAYTAALLDRDAKGPHDLVLYSNAQVLAPGETKTFTLYCTPDSLGEYYFSGRVTAWSDYGDSLITDGEMWRDPAFVVEPQSPWSYQNTGVSHTVLFPVTGYFVVHGSTLHAGDLVGVFYDSSGAAACAGFQRWTGTGNIAVSAFGDDPTTPAKDGLYAGEPFMWKVYRSDSAAAYSVDASYLPIGGIITHTNTFAANGVSSVQALTDPGALQCPVLREGWSLISSNVAPYVADLDSVFGSVREDLIILKNGAQNSYIPSVPVNTIGAWNPLEGYQLKMKIARTLCFNGQKILPQAQTLSVPAGWSIIPYYRDSVMSIAAALSGIAADVILVKDQDGQTYIPSAGINTIGTLKPGQGYQIKLASEQTLLYPAAAAEQGTDGTDALAASVAKAESGPPWFTANTGVSHTFIIPVNSNPKIVGVALSAGDCIGAFYDSSGTMACAGYGVWTGSSNLAIAAFGDDATTTNKDGFTTGESVKWRIWRQSDATVFPAVVAYAAVGSLGGIVTDTSRYATNGISAVASLNGTLTSVEPGSTPTAFALGQNYPNPFNPSTNIGYTVGAASSQQSAASHVRLAVYDLLGREVAVLVNETKEPGYYQVQFDAAGLASGIYIYRLTAGDFVATKRLTLLR